MIFKSIIKIFWRCNKNQKISIIIERFLTFNSQCVVCELISKCGEITNKLTASTLFSLPSSTCNAHHYGFYIEKVFSIIILVCYQGFRSVSAMHAWTVNPVNRFVKNLITHCSKHLFLHAWHFLITSQASNLVLLMQMSYFGIFDWLCVH